MARGLYSLPARPLPRGNTTTTSEPARATTSSATAPNEEHNDSDEGDVAGTSSIKQQASRREGIAEEERSKEDSAGEMDRPDPAKRHSSGNVLQVGGRSPGGAMKHAVGGGKSKLGARIPSAKNISKMGRAAAGHRAMMPRNTSKTHLRRNQSETALARAERESSEAEKAGPSTPPGGSTPRQAESSAAKKPQSLPRQVEARSIVKQMEDHYYREDDVSEDGEATETETETKTKLKADVRKGKQRAEPSDLDEEEPEEHEPTATTRLSSDALLAPPRLSDRKVISTEELYEAFQAQKVYDEKAKLKAERNTAQTAQPEAKVGTKHKATANPNPTPSPTTPLTPQPLTPSISLPFRPSGTFNVQANLERDRLLQMQPIHPLPPSAWKSTNMLQAAVHANDLDSEYSKKLARRMEREIDAKLESRLASTGRNPFLECLLQFQGEGGLGRSRRVDLSEVRRRGRRSVGVDEGEGGDVEEMITEEEELEEMVAGDLQELEGGDDWSDGKEECEDESDND